MAEIEFTCPNCDQVLEVDKEMAGDTIECPACNVEISVPHPDEESGEEAAECPNCAAPMDEGAVLCVECGFHTRLGRQMETDAEE